MKNLLSHDIEIMSKNYITINQINYLKKQYASSYIKVNKSFILKILNREFLRTYKNIDRIIAKRNQQYINDENKKHKLFFDNICGYPLDQNQRNAIIIDDDKNLIVAGAGSGKSLTMIGKIHYLIQKKNVSENEILCISFTNEATKSLKDKLKKIYNYDIDVYTFHKLGYQIIKDKYKNIKVAKSNLLEECINIYLNNLSKDEIINILKYFNEFTKIPKDYKAKDKHITLRAICENIDEFVRDKEEVEISNILYLKGIKYKYKKTPCGAIFHIKNKRINYYNFYNPQYNLICIDKNQGLNLYKYDFLDKGILLSTEKLLSKSNIESFPLDYKKIYVDMISNNNNYMESLKKLIVNFMNIYKSGTKSIDDLEHEIKRNTIEYRFLHIFKDIYQIYQDRLNSKNEIDINDMLLLATKLTKDKYNYKPYKYILIDEFQDTSLVRYALINNIIKHTGAKLVAVGDDFQSIYRFSGCNVDLFINFEKYFGKAKISYIENTYRNSKELIDIAGKFIMKNPSQIKKKLYSNKHIENPIKIIYYDKLSTELLKVMKTLSIEKEKIILGRNNKDINLLDNDDIKVCKDYIYCKKTKEKLPYLTVHKSKGLEFDYVFLINMQDSVIGFPSKIEEHNILKLVLPKEEDYTFAEERRLFYVALTRAKEKVFIFSPRQNPSIFVTELEKLLQNRI